MPKILFCRNQLVSIPAEGSDCDIPDNQEETQELPIDVIPRPCAHVGILGRLEMDELCGRLVNEGLRRAEKRQTAVGGIGESRNRDGRGQ